MHLAIQAISLASLQACHQHKGNKYFKCNRVKNPNWQEADQLAIYKLKRDEGFELWTTGETNLASGRVGLEPLNPGPPDYNTSALNHLATLLLRIKEITQLANHKGHRQTNEPILKKILFFEASYHNVSLTI